MNILLLGSGGREHALAWKIAQSPLLKSLFVAPGNPGTAGSGQNVPIQPSDFQAVADFCVQKEIDIVVVGPEEPLVNGITDFLYGRPDLPRLVVVGPNRAGARLEGSKDFSKGFMNRHHIPTARHLTVKRESLAGGIQFLDQLQPPYVLKADGLAAGKGVLILPTKEEARKELSDMVHGKFGKASESVLIEEFLSGIEVSVFILTDGAHYLLLPEAKDYKRIGEQDQGENTGGMGAVSPVPFADNAFMEKVRRQIIEPTLSGLMAEQITYQGFIFFGLMNVGGNPYVIEYNCRLGDPETEAILPRISSDLVPIFLRLKEQTLHRSRLDISPNCTATVMLVSEGYPGPVRKGRAISGAESGSDLPLVFHAGTSLNDQQVVTNGGRVLAVTGMDNSPEAALNSAYQRIASIHFEGMNYRKDIGQDLIAWLL